MMRSKRFLPTVAAVAALFFSFSAFVADQRAHGEVRQYVVIASELRWQVDVEKAQCLSLNKKVGSRIFKEDYSNNTEIMTKLHDFFPNAHIGDPSCPYVLTFVIEIADTRSATHRGQISRMVMSFQICERDMTGDLASKCSYKNLYLFRSDLGPLEAFEVGLKAFLSSQQNEWQTMVILLPTSI